MKPAEGTACGKAILFGEHAAVYGEPAIAIPLKSLSTTVYIEKAESDFIQPYSETAMQALQTAKNVMGIKEKVRMKVKSSIPICVGLGSSAALNVAVTRALSKLAGQKLTAKKTADIAFEMEKIFHGTPSGIDTTVSAYEKPIFFVKGKKPEFINIREKLNFIIASTGISSSTKQIVTEVREKRETDFAKYDPIIKEIGKISVESRKELEKGNVEEIGKLMNRNQALLREMQVSSPELESLISIAISNGALGAKLTGAGKGGCIIALAKNKEAAEHLKKSN